MPTSYILGELRREVANVLAPDLARYKPGCAATEDGLGLEISDLESRGIVLSVWRRRGHWSASWLTTKLICVLVLPMQSVGFLMARFMYYNQSYLKRSHVLFVYKYIFAPDILLNFFDPAGWPMLIYQFSHSMAHRIFSCVTWWIIMDKADKLDL